MTEITLSERDRLRIERIDAKWPVDNVAAMELLEEMLLEKEAAIAALERRLAFAKGQIAMMEKKIGALEGKYDL
jgi:hypothetical protein